MAIAFSSYVDITSAVGGNNGVRQRELILRIFTINPLVPTGSFVEFTDLASVGAYFGTACEEYYRAVFYFGYISKTATTPQKISYANWAQAATAPLIYGASGPQALATWNAITAGAFGLTIGGVANTFTGLNFSAAGSLAAVATIIQTSIRTKTGAQWTGATVTYDAVNQRFNFVGGTTGLAAITVQAGTGGADIAGQLGWLAANAIISNGAIATSITDTLTASADASSNFLSFIFMPTFNLAQITEAATWADGQNVRYLYCFTDTGANAATDYAALQGLSGVSANLAGPAGEYHGMMPAVLAASTDYTRRNAVINYMYQQFDNLTPTVTTTSLAQTYDAVRFNYLGQTQTAGQFLAFYQRGTLMGGQNDPVDTNVFVNEAWLKDAAGAALLSLLLSLNEVAANKTGQIQVTGALQSVINAALFNGTISVGKPLNETQILYITQITGDGNAWQQVQNIGYWVGCTLESFITTDGRTEWKAVYTLIYSKSDAIRKIDGSHILI